MSVLAWRARRSLSTTGGDCPRLIRFALHPPKNVEVEFANGSLYKLQAEYLRVFSPAVDSKIRSIGGQKLENMVIKQFLMDQCFKLGFAFHYVMIRSNDFEPCHLWTPSCRDHVCRTRRKLRGCFLMICIKPGYIHGDYFYHLGSNKSTLMRSYIKTLRKHGLSRDPRSKK